MRVLSWFLAGLLLVVSVPGLRAETDRDRDGLADVVELRLGTDPENPDSDGDGLLDGWEVEGLPGLDLPGLGADPRAKDVFVEMDFMVAPGYRLAPGPGVIPRLVEIFARAPVSNPDGSTGIRLHLELGEEVPWVEDLDVEPDSPAFFDLQEQHFAAARRPAFHYMIWVDHIRRGGSTGATGLSFGIPHSAFVVALGGLRGGNEDQQVGTFLHELGHNLGLRHGSTTDSPRKPNHLSVMSYNFQMIGLLREGAGERYDFQRFPLPSLDEDSLDEALGIGDRPELAEYQTIFFRKRRAYRSAALGPIDFDRNGVAGDAGFAQDLNNDFRRELLQATPNEWSVLQFRGGNLGELGDPGLLSRRLRARSQPCEEPPLSELFLVVPEERPLGPGR